MTNINTKDIPASTMVAIWDFERGITAYLSPASIKVVSLEEARRIKGKDRFMCGLPEIGYSEVVFEDNKFKLYKESDSGKEKRAKKDHDLERLIKRNQDLLEESGLVKLLALDGGTVRRDYEENGYSIKIKITLDRNYSVYDTMENLKTGPVLSINVWYALKAKGYFPESYAYLRVRLMTFAKYFNIKKLAEFIEWWLGKTSHGKVDGKYEYDCYITKDYTPSTSGEVSEVMKWLTENAKKELK